MVVVLRLSVAVCSAVVATVAVSSFVIDHPLRHLVRCDESDFAGMRRILQLTAQREEHPCALRVIRCGGSVSKVKRHRINDDEFDFRAVSEKLRKNVNEGDKLYHVEHAHEVRSLQHLLHCKCTDCRAQTVNVAGYC